jgi:hypothetical protein
MMYEQTVTLTIRYDPESQSPPEYFESYLEWVIGNWPTLLDVGQDEITVEDVGPVVVVEPSTYQIIRCSVDGDEWFEDLISPDQIIKTGLTLEEAQEWCRREDSRGDRWFDGYREE